MRSIIFFIQGREMRMPRQARRKSESGLHHVMVRGINQTQLFYDDEDRRAFMERLRRYKRECGFMLHAWCLMGNHVHLLVEEGRIDLSSMMKKILLSYSHYFNRKYDRRGYLFQDRYKSKPIEGDEYLLSVVRYIHRNPLEVGQTTAYWTSFDEYMETPRLADTERVLEMLDADPSKAKSAFRLLVESESDGGLPPCGIDNPARLSDREAIMLIREIAGVSECAEVCSLDKARREEAVLLLRARGLSIRQISRLTGLSKGIVERARAGKGQLPSG